MADNELANKMREEGAALIECSALLRTGNIRYTDVQEVLTASIEVLTHAQKSLKEVTYPKKA